MARIPLRRAGAVALWACMLLMGCNVPPDDAPEDAVRARLVGTWLREYEEHGTRVRRVLVLGQDGHFREYTSFQVAETAPANRSEGEGRWLYDGTNLKRHYRLVNGKPVSAPTVPFATFAIRFTSRSTFVGVDYVRRSEVRYERVADGTLP